MKTHILTLATFLGLFLFTGASQASAADSPTAPKKVLVVTITTGFRHSSIPTAEKILEQLAAKSGDFTVEFVRQPPGKPAPPPKPAALKPDASATDQAAFQAATQKFDTDLASYKTAEAAWEASLAQALMKLSPDSLKNYDGLIFCSTTGDLPIPDKEGLLAWIKEGHAFVAIHAGSDTFHHWPGYIAMLGGEFQNHKQQVGVDCINVDPKHPANIHLGPTLTITQEEIYRFKNYDASREHELLVLDKDPNDKTPGHFPVSWCHAYGKGRVFYTSLGHREDIWDTDPALPGRINPPAVGEAFQAHLLGGIRWALGLANGE